MFRLRRCSRVTRALAGCAVLALLAIPAAAQDTGTISGVVTDNQDQLVPGATVTLTNERTGATRSTTTNTRGEFAFQAVPPGSERPSTARRGRRVSSSCRSD